MKRFCVTLGALVAAVVAAHAVPTDVTYTEGDATTRYASGKQQDTSIGDVLSTGDSVKTGSDGAVELDQKGVAIKVSHGTVFTLMEREQGGKKAPVMSVALGSIKFSYGKLTGQEPLVRTNGAVMGVRGTEFTVFSGADGSTLIAVNSGQVTVEAEGKSVELAASEGVEVPLGQSPGDKFSLKSNQIDYSKWNDDKLTAMLADPMGALKSIETMLGNYIKEVNDYDSLSTDYRKKLEDAHQELTRITAEQGDAAGQKYAQETVSPLMTQVLNLGMNMRFNALAALSLRRYVGGRLYIFMKARYITQIDDPIYKDFLKEYENFLSTFESSVATHLVKADI